MIRPFHGRPSGRRRAAWHACVLAALLCAAPRPASSQTQFPPGFSQEDVFTGLQQPVAVRFAPAPDTRVFIAEKRGVVKVFDSLADSTPDVFIDITTAVHDFYDRGLLGLAVDPDFATKPYVYVFYTYNFDALDPGAGMPRWPDSCPDPPGATGDGCVVNGRLSRFEIGPGNTPVGGEQVLVENRWCQQFPSHGVGDLFFDASRALYATGGDGAAFHTPDYGQFGGSPGSPVPANPCGDPPFARGTPLPTTPAEGGSLRSQDLRTSGDPVGFSGTVIRIDPDTGAAWPTNPLVGGDPGDDAVIAFGLRNPFRGTIRPGTSEIWIGDVGQNAWEEINRILDPDDVVVENFGWPCYEGPFKNSNFDALGNTLCEDLYVENSHAGPFFEYLHNDDFDTDPPLTCSLSATSSVSGIVFYTGGSYPAQYDGALFFADFSRQCIFTMEPDAGGLPDTGTAATFADGAHLPVDLTQGPDGLLYYPDVFSGSIWRIVYGAGNTAPTAVIVASPSSGLTPLMVNLDGSGSVDPDPGAMLTYEWDLDNDGNFDDGTMATAQVTFPTQGVFTVRLRVTDELGAQDIGQVDITAGNTAPSVSIDFPLPGATWQVGQSLTFNASANDPEDGALPASAFSWEVRLQHCESGPTGCHGHFVQNLAGDDELVFTAPDHPWYSFLEVQVTVTDSGFPGGGGGTLSASETMELQPVSVDLDLLSSPPGLVLAAGELNQAAPYTGTYIVGGAVALAAESPQDLQGGSYVFNSWSDGGAQSHVITAPAATQALTAQFSYAGVASDWWDREWGRRRKILLQNASRPGDEDDVPVLVLLDAGRIDYAATLPAGADLRFVDADLTPLSHEIELWNPAGTSVVWVKIPRVDGGSDADFFWMYHDNPSALDGQDAGGVWSNGFVGVWHLGQDTLDSTAFANHGTNNGTGVTAGRIGQGRVFDGGDWIDAGNHSSLAPAGTLTVEAWIQRGTPAPPDDRRIVSKKVLSGDADGYTLEHNADSEYVRGEGGGATFGEAVAQVFDSGWSYLAATFSGIDMRIYRDGVGVTTDPTVDPVVAGTTPVNIGRMGNGADGWIGELDEVRIASVARTPGWIALQHASMTDTLLVFQADQDVCGPSDPTCDGWDDDCDGFIDEDAQPPSTPPLLLLHKSEGATWPGTESTHDLIRGSLTGLAAGGGDLGATAECLLDDTTLTGTIDYEDPPPGEGFWYLLRAVNCAGPGSWDSGGPSQAVSRSPSLDASSGVCP